ncbi:Hypothetical predicted protein [Paramuricea clavata]|uniref:Uncharacterized protein n=1 Tax=Paramuricea clavata TaxID=317549 RepID=A0A6S7FY61_PARCT|nr:Hypothetical predicted protein [Paramuricea clavata]
MDDQEMSQDEKYVVHQFQESVNFDGERYEVELPRKTNCPKLVYNRKIAMKRLVNVEARLKRNREQLVMYKESKRQSTMINQRKYNIYCIILYLEKISCYYDGRRVENVFAKANGDKFPEACAKIIKEDTYVDDCLAGTNNEESAFTLYQDLANLMKIGGFDLVKWSTNSSQLRSRIPSDQRVPERIVCLDSDSEPLNSLGLSWDTEEDVFLFHQGNKLFELSDPKTKRSLVSISSKLFDPLRFIDPFTIRAMILYQEVWLRGFTWDAPLTQDIKEQ